MNSENLYDAITNINDGLVNAAGDFCHRHKRNFRKKSIRFAVTALVTAAAIFAGVIFWPDASSSRLLSAYAITEAEYPKMVQYPKDLSENELSFRPAYSEWYVSLERQRNLATVEYSDKLKSYVNNSLMCSPEFVADRPFLFVISYEDDLPLFAGVVNQP